MKIKHTIRAAAMRMVLLTTALTGLAHAQTIAAGDGVDLRDTGYIEGAPPIEGGLQDVLQDVAGFIVPVSQFTGLKGDGTDLAYNDLIPLKSSSIEIVTGAGGDAPTGTAVLIDGNGIATNALSIFNSGPNTQAAITVVNGVLLVNGTAAGVTGPAGPAGADGAVGPQGPAGAAGADGAVGPQGPIGLTGPAGPAGADGADGADGSSILSGSGAPGAGTGVDGDFYIDTATNTIYGPKAGGTWPAGTSIVGAQGEQGPVGPQGPQGPAGQDLQALGNLALSTPQDNPGSVATTPGQTAINTDGTGTLPAGPVMWNGLTWVSLVNSTPSTDVGPTESGTTVTAPAGTVGDPYIGQVTTDASAPVIYLAIGLPDGLICNSTNGLISGTPTTAGTYSYSISVSNSVGALLKTGSITISDALAPPTSGGTTLNTPAGNVSVSYTGGVTTDAGAPVTYSVQSGSLPAGLTLNTTTGAITGTPTTVGTANFTIRVENAAGLVDKAGSITIGAAPVGFEFINMPAGTLTQLATVAGSWPITAFQMAKDETTKGQWDTVRAWGASNGYSDLPVGATTGGTASNSRPVDSVTWYAVVKWCNAASQKDGLTPVYYTDGTFTTVYKTGSIAPVANPAANGYRLPYEKEWEWAARSGNNNGSNGFTNSTYPWGSTTINNTYANYSGTGLGRSNLVGSYPLGNTSLGLRDMGGNLWEWNFDAFSSNRVIRGGGWILSAPYLTVSYRHYNAPASSGSNFGFRVARN